MSLQWTLASLFLYAEIIFVISLLLPGITTRKWKSLFESHFVEVINRKAHLFFNFTIIVLTVFLLDAIREIIRQDSASSLSQAAKDTLDITSPTSSATREMRSQRNLYIAGMSLFLWFVIKRLVVLISTAADTAEDYELADRECKELRRELELMQTKYSTYSAIINQQSSTTSDASGEANEAAERAQKLAEDKIRSRSRGRKEL